MRDKPHYRQNRQKRELREQEIIRITMIQLSEHGFLDVRMSDIARETKYSMGTIYSHFESKEDLIIACAYTLVQEHKLLFQAILAEKISAIEKIITMAQCSWHLSMYHPELIEIDHLSLMHSVWHRATQLRTQQLKELQIELANSFLGIALEAIETCVLSHQTLDALEKKKLAYHLTHGMWGLCVGLSSTAQSAYTRSVSSITNHENIEQENRELESYEHFATNYSRFLQGYGWQEKHPQKIFQACRAIALKCINQTTWFADGKADTSNKQNNGE